MIQAIKVLFADQKGVNSEISNTPLTLMPEAGGRTDPEVKREGEPHLPSVPHQHQNREEQALDLTWVAQENQSVVRGMGEPAPNL